MTIVVLPIGRTKPTEWNLSPFDEVELAVSTAATIFRVLVPILLRPYWNRPPDYKIVAELTQRWLHRINEARRRAAAESLFGRWNRAALVVSAA